MPKFVLPKIYPVTDTRVSGLSHLRQVEELINGGARLIQLREKHSSARDFYEAAEEAIKLARRSSVRIIINDRVDIALALKADGVHLGQDDLPPEYARRILGPDAIIGFSTHSPQQALAALKLPIDYIAIGPIFATTTKENSETPLGIDGLKKVREITAYIPLTAIGGISPANLKYIFEAGADSAALIGALVSDSTNIAEKLRNLSREA
ncbi:MAG: thiamine phosphate synthase [Pyrinomonadaceae bacterium]